MSRTERGKWNTGQRGMTLTQLDKLLTEAKTRSNPGIQDAGPLIISPTAPQPSSPLREVVGHHSSYASVAPSNGSSADIEGTGSVREPIGRIEDVLRVLRSRRLASVVTSDEIASSSDESTFTTKLRSNTSKLTLKQQEENRRKRKGLVDANRGLLHAYGQDSRLLTFARKLLQPAPFYDEGMDYQARRRKFVGGIFEIIAYEQELLGLNNEADNTTVLDANKTLEFYRSFFPFGELIHGEFGQTGIIGISVPDFLITREGNLDAIIELTFGNYKKYFDGKYEHFDGTRKSNKEGEFFKNASLIFVVPTDFPIDDARKITKRYKDVGVAIAEDISRSDLIKLSFELEHRQARKIPA